MTTAQNTVTEAAREADPRPSSVDSILGERAGPRGSSGDEVAAATRPVGAASYVSWHKVWLPIPVIIVLLDVLFPFYFWRIPKLSGTSDDYSYQLLYDLHRMQVTPPAGVRVLAFGSSVTTAFEPYQVRGLLERVFPGEDIEVARLMQPGIKPSDYRILWSSEIARVDAPVVVALFNLVDFLNPSFERNLKPGIRSVLPPWETLLARWDFIPNAADKLEMVVASVSNLYRYRKLIRSSIRDHAKLVRSWWRAGSRNQVYGISADGYTSPRFALPPASEIEYFVAPHWIEQRGVVRVAFVHEGREVARREHREPGWKTVRLDVPADASGVVHGAVEGGWSPRAAGELDDTRLLGVRLRQPPAVSPSERGSPPVGYPPVDPSDIKPFLRMGSLRGDEYARKWRDALTADSNFALRYRLYHDAKVERAGSLFEVDEEFAEFERLIEHIVAGGRRVVLVNTPESPLLEGVVESQFYADYLAFFAELAIGDPRVTFLDLHDHVPAEDLNDWHHVNFVGQVRVGVAVAGHLEAIVADVIRQRAEAH